MKSTPALRLQFRSRIESFYCRTELEDGMACNHHRDVHRQKTGRCSGLNVWGGPCPCGRFTQKEIT